MEQVKHDLSEECRKGSFGELYPVGEQKVIIDVQPVENVDKSRFPLFSILVLCYKNIELLFGMLDSIFVQDYPRIQLIVSDDGSEDFDVERVQTYIDLHKRQNIEQVIVRKNDENMRTVKHVHMALSLAEGEYVVFTAADDRFAGNTALSAYVEQFLENPDSYWLVARCNVTTADYKKLVYNTPTAADAPYFEEGDARKLFSRWSRRGMAIPCCMAFRKDAFGLVGGIDLDYQFLEDWPLELKLLRNGYAPLYYKGITAVHSTGGISNSNNRYGKEIRKMFYDDKYLIFKKEVDPYIDLLLPEDRKAYKQYLREIMARHYFFYIDWPGESTLHRAKLCLKKPIRFWWAFEQGYVKKVQGKLQRKKLFASSQGLLFLALLFLSVNSTPVIEGVFQFMGWLDLLVAVAVFLVSVLTFPLEKYFRYKARLRTKLVN